MTIHAQALSLVQESLRDHGDILLSQTLKKAIRVARLLHDYDNLWWLELELLDPLDEEAGKQHADRMKVHYSRDEYAEIGGRIVHLYSTERRSPTPQEDGSWKDIGGSLPASVLDLEQAIPRVVAAAAGIEPAGGIFPPTQRDIGRAKSVVENIARRFTHEYQLVLNRISTRVFTYLSETEQALLERRFPSSLERTFELLERKLEKVAPEAVSQLRAAHRRLSEGDSEAHSHALTSCRRLLKTLADLLYPASVEEVVGADGTPRVLTEGMYIARLWQFANDRVGSHKSGKLLMEAVNDLGRRIDRLYDLASKGVHGSPTPDETEQCVVQTYFLVGDLLRLQEGTSSIVVEDVPGP
jgi:hypothetical protein